MPSTPQLAVRIWAAWIAVILLTPFTHANSLLPAVELGLPSLRRPVAMAVNEPWLYVTNRYSGTVSVVDLRSKTVVNEVKVGERLESCRYDAHRDHLFVVDSKEHELLVLSTNDAELSLIQRIAVATHPVNVGLSTDGNTCLTTSLWSRRLTMLHRDASTGSRWRVRATIDLPFAPRKQVFLPDNKHTVVADSFGGRLAVIDLKSATVSRLLSMDAHNIRGLAIGHDGTSLLVTHQLLNGYVPTTHERVFWGTLMGNVVRTIEIRELLSGEASKDVAETREVAHWSLLPLGEPEDAAGDPEGIAVTNQGRMAIAIAGVNQLAIQSAPRQPVTRVAVGRRPTALALRPDEQICYVANTFDDSISIVDLASKKVTSTISLGRQRDTTVAEKGEVLFHDSRLSLDGWFSCHSCHTDGHTNGQVTDNFADGTTGASKRVLTLLGVSRTQPWSWNGNKESLSDQIHSSITTTMRGKKGQSTPETRAALVAYLESLVPPPTVHQARRAEDPIAVARGRRVFEEYNCAKCHAPPTYTTTATYDVNLEDESGENRFNPPSLRGVSQQESFFHDGRARSLRGVFEHFHHFDSEGMSTQEIDDLLEFLQSL